MGRRAFRISRRKNAPSGSGVLDNIKAYPLLWRKLIYCKKILGLPVKSHVTLLACTIGSGEEKNSSNQKLSKGACASERSRNPQSIKRRPDARDGRIASRLPLDAHADRLDVSALDVRISSTNSLSAAFRVACARPAVLLLSLCDQ